MPAKASGTYNESIVASKSWFRQAHMQGFRELANFTIRQMQKNARGFQRSFPPKVKLNYYTVNPEQLILCVI
jgi:hypothetical protein